MKANFNDCLNRLLKDEGGYSNDPSDSGGATNFGITIADYRKYIDKAGTPADVKAMSADQAKTIYRQKYWDALGCDSLASGVDYSVFDYGVNSGLGRPRSCLQQFKDKTGTDPINAINDERTAFLRRIGVGKNAKFLKGWLARVSRVRQHSLDLSKQSPAVGTAIGTTGIGLSVGLSQFWHNHEYLILGGGVVAAVVAGIAIHHYLKGK